MKLLIITQTVDKNDLYLGFFHRWIEEFAKRCEQVTVICLEEGKHNFYSAKNAVPRSENSEEFSGTGVRVFSLGKERGGSRARKTVRYIVQFYALIWRERKNYDAVFVHMNPIYVVLGGLLWRLLGKEIGLWYAHKSVDTKLRIATFLAHYIFTPSELSFRLSTKKKHVLGHGIDTDLFSPSQHRESPSIILSVGRISEVKNYEMLIEAIRILNEKGAVSPVRVAGAPATEEDQVYDKKLREIIRALGFDHIISFIGGTSREGMVGMLQGTIVFVNMSRTGSLDKAVLEAMSSGVPVLTSNEAFVDILGEHTETLMFRDAHELVQKIVRIRDMSQEERSVLAEHLRRIIVERHNLKVLIPRILSFYAAGK